MWTPGPVLDRPVVLAKRRWGGIAIIDWIFYLVPGNMDQTPDRVPVRVGPVLCSTEYIQRKSCQWLIRIMESNLSNTIHTLPRTHLPTCQHVSGVQPASCTWRSSLATSWNWELFLRTLRTSVQSSLNDAMKEDFYPSSYIPY